MGAVVGGPAIGSTLPPLRSEFRLQKHSRSIALPVARDLPTAPPILNDASRFRIESTHRLSTPPARRGALGPDPFGSLAPKEPAFRRTTLRSTPRRPFRQAHSISQQAPTRPLRYRLPIQMPSHRSPEYSRASALQRVRPAKVHAASCLSVRAAFVTVQGEGFAIE